jgi:glutathione S-transferase
LNVKPHQLIGAPVSLYTGKVRAYLRYKQIPFEEVLATREVYRSVIVPRTGVRYIPMLITDDDVAIQDSTEIIDWLEQRHPLPAVYPETPAQRLVALLFEVYGDEWLVIPAMHYRWNVAENRAFALREFGATSAPDKTPEEQLTLGEALAQPFAGALPPLGISERSAPAIEASYQHFLTDFDRHLQHAPFLLGTRPCIGDFGLLGPLYAHLYRDPYSGRMMKQRAPHVARWVERMCEPTADTGSYVPNDEVPETLIPLLVRMFCEQVPVLRDTAEQIRIWADADPSRSELPRAIGRHRYSVEGVDEQRAIYPYSVWMWQRPHDHYRALDAAARAQLAPLLAALPGADTVFSTPIPRRVERRANKLVLAE